VANLDAHNAAVFLGLGDGTFSDGRLYGTGYGPISLAVGDLNGDQAPDLAVANVFSDDVAVLLGTMSIAGIEDQHDHRLFLPQLSVSPNPVGSQAAITFHLQETARARLRLFDVTGRLVQSILDRTLIAGRHRAVCEIVRTTGTRIRSGVYFVALEVNGRTATQRLICLE
jgi:hypothetical protein